MSLMSRERALGANIAVIGAGIFGATAAIELAKAGHQVTLFESRDDILQAASGINQYRMHRGYHYPRSQETIASCMDATPLFEAEYTDAIISHLTHYYAIAKEGSKVSGHEYLTVLDTSGLPYTVTNPEHIHKDMVDVVISADENLYDPNKLREIVRERIAAQGIELRLGSKVHIAELDNFDAVVVATYAALNDTIHEGAQKSYQFEVCEKIVVEIPPELRGVSTVIMDGPFMCIDPLGDTGYAVMGHVEHAVHHRSVGSSPVVPEELRDYLNRGVIERPKVSNVEKFLDAASIFMPALKDAKHVGSMFTIRTVLPRVDHTDERPTIVRQVNDRIFTIYSGKVGNSVKAARDVVQRIEKALQS